MNQAIHKIDVIILPIHPNPAQKTNTRYGTISKKKYRPGFPAITIVKKVLCQLINASYHLYHAFLKTKHRAIIKKIIRAIAPIINPVPHHPNRLSKPSVGKDPNASTLVVPKSNDPHIRSPLVAV